MRCFAPGVAGYSNNGIPAGAGCTVEVIPESGRFPGERRLFIVRPSPPGDVGPTFVSGALRAECAIPGLFQLLLQIGKHFGPCRFRQRRSVAQREEKDINDPG